jgi:putative transcriptional regulator
MSSLAGSFLVARTTLRDSIFQQTVVLLLQHDDDGAFGLVVNRPADVKGLPFPVFAGGPCQSQGLLMLHGHAEWAEASEEPGQAEMAPGVFLGDSTCLTHVTNADPDKALRYRIFAGYSGWGPKQLEGELTVGAWAVVPASGQVLWSTPPEELWSLLLPPTIPEPSLN